MSGCAPFRDLIAQAAYEPLDAESADSLASHLQHCAECRRVRDDFDRVLSLTGRGDTPVPVVKRAAFLSRLRMFADRKTPRRYVRKPTRSRWIWAAAGVAAVLFVTILAAGSRNEPSLPTQTAATAPRPAPLDPPPPPPPLPLSTSPARPPLEPVPVTEPPRPLPPPPVAVVRPEPEAAPVPVPVPAPKPVPPPAETRPAPAAPPVTIALETGRTTDRSWNGARAFAPGEEIRARTTLRLRWAGATLFVRNGSRLKVEGPEAFYLEAGAVLIENFGGRFAVRTAHGILREEGTRFLVAAGARTETVVYEGRVLCESREPRRLQAGDRAFVGMAGTVRVERIRNLDAVPSWAARSMAPRIDRFSLRFRGREWKQHPLAGTVRDGVLLQAVRWGDGYYLGVEHDPTRPFTTIPESGEVRTTYFTSTEDPITLRIRVPRPESTAYDAILERPVPNRWIPVRVPLSKFKTADGRGLKPGDPVHIFYVSSADPGLSILDVAVHEIKGAGR